MKVQVQDLSYSISDRQLLRSISLDLPARNIVGLIGPNGSGKSTLLKNLYRVLKPDVGAVWLNGRDMFRQKQRETAQVMAVVTQETAPAFDFTVLEVVLMGRNPHKKIFDTVNAADLETAWLALTKVGLDELANRSFSTLSGGEKQRAIIARAIAQEARLLILDEPTNHLDIHYQLQIMDLIKILGISTLIALHDLNIAAFYCDLIYVLEGGQVVANGNPETIFQPDLLRAVFKVETEIRQHPHTGKPVITFLPRILANTI